MGIIYADLRLSNPSRPDLEEINAKAVVDTGALHLCIPEHVAVQLGLKIVEQREAKTADGKSHLVDYAGPIQIEVFGRHCLTGALILGDQVLLGAIPLEDMDIVVDPARRKITVNPASPNIALSLALGFKAHQD
ncbi:MAG: clan AA aspartic protease [Rhodospirillales bacterium RIFCSPLOWO2_12_FULL_58_28]|nr:MAG: clan AA aspartic protease [Rhodospirillales bacterium RIFCSPLOWO2_02_FULL_58_16]OHC79125.1 MAG: clan AA aspartic protease [Rhodospirillales bacterium RIFCSPLOWO2_12_FULL_58_28]